MNQNFYRGIMFHNFHDSKKHLKVPGSITKHDLEKIINKVGKKNILNADTFYQFLKNKQLRKNHTCFTFDDGIKSQVDIALPILEKYKIKAFFFIYTSIFSDKPDFLEVYRYFRANFFKNQKCFYDLFYKVSEIEKRQIKKNFKKLITSKKKLFPFYSIDDIIFRIARDELLTKKKYSSIMKKIFLLKKFNPKKILKNIFINKKDVSKLIKKGHIIGLHSHSHPTIMGKKNYTFQFREYYSCKKILEENFKQKIFCMSHPNGSYNKITLNILKKLNINLGFKQTLTVEKSMGMNKINNTDLEIARIDHSNLIKNL